MKKFVLNIFLGVMICSLISCASPSFYRTRTIPLLSNDILPGSNETEIIIRNEVVYTDSSGKPFSDTNWLLFVYIDDILVAQIDHANSERIIVPNGEHRIRVQYINERQNHPKEIKFTANSERLTFRAIYAKVEVVDGVAVFSAVIGTIGTIGLGAPFLIGADFKDQKLFLLLQQIE